MIHLNTVIKSANSKSIISDIYYNETNKPKPIVIFCHGYKGFKDWGAWHLVATSFMKDNCFFVKFNFSHNGGTISNPIDFPDLDAFSKNNYTKELNDLDIVLNFILSESRHFKNEIDVNNITLIGHSRGGGIACIKASEDTRISKLITWASVSDFSTRFGNELEINAWKKNGVKHVLNGRTKQQMPHLYQFYLDFKKNEERLNIKKAVSTLNKPHLIIHAKEDQSVKFEEAKQLHEWNPKSELLTINESNHVFGARHPWNKNELPVALKQVLIASLNFIKI